MKLWHIILGLFLSTLMLCWLLVCFILWIAAILRANGVKGV